MNNSLPVNWNNFKLDELEDVIGMLNGDDGRMFLSFMAEAMRFPINELIKEEKDGDRNRGRIDICDAVINLPKHLSKEIDWRRNLAKAKNEK